MASYDYDLFVIGVGSGAYERPNERILWCAGCDR